MMNRNPEKGSVLPDSEVARLSRKLITDLEATYQPGRDRVVTPANVHQPAVLEGQSVMEELADRLLLAGSRVEGEENLDDCLKRLERGESVLLLPEHRGNLDASTFHSLLRRDGRKKYEPILTKLVYIAGRKLNESSELIKMYTEKYSRLVIVPRRDLPPPHPGEGAAEKKGRVDLEQAAAKINRAAFRQLVRLRRAGYLFVLFPLGGREKPDADNVPVRETVSYLRAFDTCYLISMEGNLLKPLPRMEDERPRQDRVVFRVGPAIGCDALLRGQRRQFEAAQASGTLEDGLDFEQFTANRIIELLADLRRTGRFDLGFPFAP